MILRTLMVAVAVMGMFLISGYSNQVAAQQACIWEGKAPACNGKCRPGYTLTKQDKRGPDGAKKCLTGTKAYCCKTSDVIIIGTAPACNGKCGVGQETLGKSDYGPNGKKCITGKAAICRLAIP